MIDFAVISPFLARNVELTVDWRLRLHRTASLKLQWSICQITLTSQLRPPPMLWKPEMDITAEVANEFWSGMASFKPKCGRQQGPCLALEASVAFRTFGAVSSILQPKIQTWLQRLSAYRRFWRDNHLPADWLETTRCGRPRFRETSITGRHSWRDVVTSDSLAGWWHTVSARLADCAAVSKCSYTGAQKHLQNNFRILEKLQVSMSHATPMEMTLGDYPYPDLEVSLIQQRERFKRSLSRVNVLEISEIS